MRYDYQCISCNRIEEKSHSIKESPKYLCPDCNSSMKRLISLNTTGFTFKGGTPDQHRREKESRNKKSMKMKETTLERSKNRYMPNVCPNIAGVETDSWSDAQKMAKEAGMNTKSYEPWVAKEKKEKKGAIKIYK